jgi:hypothetical protein
MGESGSCSSPPELAADGGWWRVAGGGGWRLRGQGRVGLGIRVRSVLLYSSVCDGMIWNFLGGSNAKVPERLTGWTLHESPTKTNTSMWYSGGGPSYIREIRSHPFLGRCFSVCITLAS